MKKLREIIIEAKKEKFKVIKTPEGKHKIVISGEQMANWLFSSKPPKGDMKFLPKFNNKPGTKGHFDELLAHHEYHNERWYDESQKKPRPSHLQNLLTHPDPDTPAMKHHAKVITALEDHAEKHYMKTWSKIKHENPHVDPKNRWHFRNMLDNISNAREGSDFKESGEREAAAVRKRLPD